MSMPQSHLVNRRFFLRAAGITLALPLLDSLSRRVLGAGLGVASKAGAKIGAARPTRMVGIGNMLGFYRPEFFPKKTGRRYDLPLLLQPLAPHQNDFTLFSGLDHGVKGGHFAIHSYLSGVRQVDAKGMPEGNISLDQRAAETVGGATRFPSLTIGSEDGLHGGCMMCWTRSGTRVPPIPGPKELFRKLFITDSGSDRERSADRFALHGSILDAVNGDAKSLGRHLGKRDQEKLDEYFTSVRDVEKQMELGKRWADVPKPKPGMEEPPNTGFVSDLPVLYDLIALALQTDATRIATLEIAGGFEASAFGLRKDYHALSHHGQVQESIDGLLKLETCQMEQFARFIAKLKSLDDGDGKLLDHTMVLFGSGMGNANAHTNYNLPMIFAGGGYKHGEHRAYPEKGLGRVPLSNLYLSMLQRFGVETDRFGLSTGTMRDLEMA
ncbi:MAG: DUF1552 domain-containing protein [Verrucomicrobiota bacterium]|nr:DUF1552 domain-containing protein [Verrucomicrobiota bacterium]